MCVHLQEHVCGWGERKRGCISGLNVQVCVGEWSTIRSKGFSANFIKGIKQAGDCEEGVDALHQIANDSTPSHPLTIPNTN